MEVLIALNVEAFSDTITFSGRKNDTLQLSKRLIISESVRVFMDDKLVVVEHIDWINGKITIPKGRYSHENKFIIHYKYYPNTFPISVGPKWKYLPSLKIKKNSDIKISPILKPKLDKQSKNSKIFSSGNIFRQLNMPEMGSSEFSGGLQMQLIGNMGNEVKISGVLSDRNIQLDQNGTTTSIETLDQIYLNISHPSFSADAGNIMYNHEYLKDHSIERKLVGIKNKFSANSWNGSSVYAGSRSIFHTLTIQGEDGVQGPYVLYGKNGEREILVLSGTEKVWVDGKEQVRGHNYDYTINYNSAEVFFTPNILIHSQSDILIEFQYTNFNYSKLFRGGAVEKDFNANGKLSFGIFQESDQWNSEGWNKSSIDLINNSKNELIEINTYSLHKNGDYVFIDSVFIYDPDFKIKNEERFKVTFYYDNNGEYERLISTKGLAFYAFIPIEERSQTSELYSPYKQFETPKNHKFGYIQSNILFGDKVSIEGTLSGSQFDKNKLSSQKYNNGNGFSRKVTIKADSLELGDAVVGFKISNWLKDRKYKAIGTESNLRQQIYWNERNIYENGISETDFKTEIKIRGFGSTIFEKSLLGTEQKSYEATYFKQKVTRTLFEESYIDVKHIKKENGVFKKANSRFNAQLKKYSPFVTYMYEFNPQDFELITYGIGLNYGNKYKLLESGINLRANKTYNEKLDKKWELESEDLIGFINYKTKNKNGWKNDVVYKKRMKIYNSNSKFFNYSLSRIRLNYKNSISPFKWDFFFKTEKSFSRQRAVVFDSLGLGLGNYRYDSNYNTYVSDPNGSYQSYILNVGERQAISNAELKNRFIIDFRGRNGYPKILLRSNTKIDFEGPKLELNKALKPSLIDTSLIRTLFTSRLELEYYAKDRVLTWIEIQHLLNGYNPSGNELNKGWNVGVELIKHYDSIITIQNKSKYKSKIISSSLTINRNRVINGWWNESHFLIEKDKMLDMDIGIIIGRDYGFISDDSFVAKAKGLSMDSRIFINKNLRLQSRLEFFNVAVADNIKYLPPEALNGYPINNSIRTNTRLNYFINKTFSMSLSINTINDNRYKNLKSIMGEARAHF